MKIIKQGQLHDEKTYQCTCGDCGTGFEFSGKDCVGEFYYGNRPITGCPLCYRICSVPMPEKNNVYIKD